VTGVFVPWSNRRNSPGWVEDGSGCHIWVGGSLKGYGLVWVNGTMRYVHRVRWEAVHGPVPKGLPLDHFVCNNPGCCNPDHVRPATHRENVLRGDGPASRNAAKAHCKRGHSLLDPANLVASSLRLYGKRICRTCHNTLRRKGRTDG
jgi:hypothetical protein